MRNLSIALILAALSCAVYWPARHLPFINYDDEGYVYENPHVMKGLSWSTVKWAAGSYDLANYHPITWISFAADISAFGLRPARFHQENVLLNALNTALLFWFLSLATKNTPAAGLAAALFCVHPLHVESVAWVSERKDLLSTLGFLLALSAYLIYVRHGCRRWPAYLAMVFFFAFGLLAKPMIVTFPLVLLLFDYWPLQRTSIRLSKRMVEKLPLFALSAWSCWMTIKVQNAGGAMMTLDKLPVGARLANAVISYARYVGKAIWPAGLSIFYPHPIGWPIGWVIGSATLLIVISSLCIRIARRHPFMIVGWLFFLGTLVPVIGLVQVGWQSIADRYMYLPLLGLIIMVTWAVDAILHRVGKSGKALGAVGIAGVFIASITVTDLQLQHWRNTRDLFEHALAVTADNAVAHVQLGYLEAGLRHPMESQWHYEEALRIDPTYYVAEYNLANLLLKTRPDEAAEHYRRAAEDQPNSAKVQNNWALAELALNQPALAVRHFQAAAQLDPTFPQPHFGLGLILLSGNQVDRAEVEFKTALQIDPDFVGAQRGLQAVAAARNPPPK